MRSERSLLEQHHLQEVAACHPPCMHADMDLSRLSELWQDVRGSAEGAELEAELTREVSAAHPLEHVGLQAVAVRRLRKEVIYALPDGRWAWVHLTWTKENDPRWPSTVIVPSWDALLVEIQDADRA